MHYIVMAGLRGCMPNCCYSVDTIKEGAEIMASIHELSTSYILKNLYKYRHMDLILNKHGNEYISIQECQCDNEKIHNDF